MNDRRSNPPPELYNTDAKTTADGLAALPRDYTGLPKNVPKLGPPLPGDLGRPILAAQGQLPQSTIDPEEQRMGQEREAARTAKLFASTNTHERVGTTRRANSITRARIFISTLALLLRTGAHRSWRDPEYAGSQARLRQCAGRSSHGEPRSARTSSFPLRPASRRCDSGGARHRHTLRSSRPDYRAGD